MSEPATFDDANANLEQHRPKPDRKIHKSKFKTDNSKSKI